MSSNNFWSQYYLQSPDFQKGQLWSFKSMNYVVIDLILVIQHAIPIFTRMQSSQDSGCLWYALTETWDEYRQRHLTNGHAYLGSQTPSRNSRSDVWSLDPMFKLAPDHNDSKASGATNGSPNPSWTLLQPTCKDTSPSAIYRIRQRTET